MLEGRKPRPQITPAKFHSGIPIYMRILSTTSFPPFLANLQYYFFNTCDFQPPPHLYKIFHSSSVWNNFAFHIWHALRHFNTKSTFFFFFYSMLVLWGKHTTAIRSSQMNIWQEKLCNKQIIWQIDSDKWCTIWNIKLCAS